MTATRLFVLLVVVACIAVDVRGWETIITDIPGDQVHPAEGRAVAASADGNAVVGGSRDFVVLDLAAADGAERWRHDLGAGAADGIAVGSDGAVVAAGFSPAAFTVVKVSGDTGSELWRHDIAGTDFTQPIRAGDEPPRASSTGTDARAPTGSRASP